MSISNKTRKLLWGKSGNRCAFCRKELSIDSTAVSDQSIVGEECHLVSEKPNGPRFDESFPKEKVAAYENLILLCRVHHKIIDDQHETYSVEILKGIKEKHEHWVSSQLDESETEKPVKIRRVKENIPTHLKQIKSGKELLNLSGGSCASSLDHDELETSDEVHLIGSFFQNIRDWSELYDELEEYQKVEAGFGLTQEIKDIEEAGFSIFGTREIQVLEGGIGSPSNWPVFILRILRQSNPEIIKISDINSDK